MGRTADAGRAHVVELANVRTAQRGDMSRLIDHIGAVKSHGRVKLVFGPHFRDPLLDRGSRAGLDDIEGVERVPMPDPAVAANRFDVSFNRVEDYGHLGSTSPVKNLE
jgi:hypothetical protein